MDTKGITASIVVGVGSGAIALAAGEIALRMFPTLLPVDLQERLQWRSQSEPVAVAHSYVGFLYPENHVAHIRMHDFDFIYRTDEQGFRNESSSGTAEIVVVGDSMAFSYGVDDSHAWPKVLSDSLPGIRVANLGLVAAAPQQYFRVYETFGRDYNPKLVVFSLFPGNDVIDEELFRQWLAEDGEGNYYVWRYFEQDPRPARGVAKSYLVAFVRETLRRARDGYSSHRIQLEDDRLHLNLYPRMLARNSEGAEIGDHRFEQVFSSIEEARRAVRADGAKMLVLLMPTKEEVYLPLEGLPTPAPVKAFRKALEKRGLRYLDLTPGLQAHARAGQQLYFPIDGHLNVAGNRVVADALQAYLQENSAELGLGTLDSPEG